MKNIVLLTILFLNLSLYSDAQVFFQESFETETGWTLSHSFDNGGNSYAKRDLNTNFTGLEFFLFGQDGTYLIGAENTEASTIGAPEDGIVTLDLDPISIVGKTNIQCVVSVACNINDQSYDDISFANGDFLDFRVSIDNGAWIPIGAFVSLPDSDGNSGLYHDANLNYNGGDIGDAPVTSGFTDFVLPISGTGNNIKIQARFKMTESTEEIVFDNIRLREQTADDTAPTINSVEVINDQNIRVFFNEAMGANANLTTNYTSINNLNSVTLSNGNFEALLNYSVPLEIGTEYNLIIFGPQDATGNPMSTPLITTLFYNPTQPDLVITEIMYNDPNNADTLEFIEVYNAESFAIQIGGFTISDAVDFTFPSTSLNPGETYLIARKDLPASEFYGENFGNYAGSLSNAGATIRIRNTFDQVLDFVIYDDILPWPPAGDGAGSSISLVDPLSDNAIGSNWVGSTNGVGFVDGEAVYASPGYIPSGILPVLQFTAGEFAANEDAGTITVSMVMAASNGSQSVANLNWAAGGTANGSDISLSGNESIVFPANSNGITDLAFTLTNDNILEGFEWIKLEITSTTNANTGLNASTNILINDDEFSAPTLFINEIQSVNQFDVTDENGQNEDWIEIYNPNNFSVDLSGYFFTDDGADLTKDRIDYESGLAIVPAQSWILFWADKDKGQGPLHIDIKLSSLGEAIVLVAPNGTSVVDNIQFPALSPDETYGRQLDGNSNLIVLPVSTPDASNNANGIDEFIQNSKLFVYPNPTNEMLQWNKIGDIRLYSLDGKLLLSEMKVSQIDVSNLNPGIYVLIIVGDDTTIHRISVSK